MGAAAAADRIRKMLGVGNQPLVSRSPDIVHDRLYLRQHRSRGELAFSGVAFRLGARHRIDGTLSTLTVIKADLLHCRGYHEGIGIEPLREYRGGKVLINDGLTPL